MFPQCFTYLLELQKEDGTWTSYRSQIDGILNTSAALLAMFERRKRKPDESETLDSRIESAKSGLQELLSKWDVENTVQVGFEILVTCLMHQLQHFNAHFAFPGQFMLQEVYEHKMQNFAPQAVYKAQQMTVLHSVEALVGVIDFDRIKHHCTEMSGIMASPAATAAYLIHSTHWDVKAERYLKGVLSAYGNNGTAPSAFPTSVFEITWALSNLLPHSKLQSYTALGLLPAVGDMLMAQLKSQDGVMGFAPGLLPDADDTARTLITLKRLGYDIDCAPMIHRFEGSDHFRTYELERNPSISANCNVLLALLEARTVDEHSQEIEKIVTFLLNACRTEEIPDKWNVSPLYTSMLMVEAFVGLLKRCNQGSLQSLPVVMRDQQVPVSIAQLLLRTLSSQLLDGSWSSSLEETSYAIATLLQCTCLPFNKATIARLKKAIEAGQQYVVVCYPTDKGTDYFWVEKTNYEPEFLKTVYCSMAVWSGASETLSWTSDIIRAFNVAQSHAGRIAALLSLLPVMKTFPLASLDLVLLEASYAASNLRNKHNIIMQRSEIGFTKDKYLDYIPVIWLACNHMAGHAVKDSAIREMLLLSLLIYQIDEYTESVIAKLDQSCLQTLVLQIAFECGLEEGSEPPQQPQQKRLKTSHDREGSAGPQISGHSDVLGPILAVQRKFIAHVLSHAAVLAAPPWIQRILALELHNYIVGQILHSCDNLTLSTARSPGYGFRARDHARATYYKWVHSTGADDTSCSFAWLFFICLISPPGKTCLDKTLSRYAAEAFVHRLGVMCRMYNDYGSLQRDAEEGNVNSTNFEEFESTQGQSEKKTVLMAIAEFERKGVDIAWGALEDEIKDPGMVEKLKVFLNVTDMFGQIYVAKDISSRNHSRKA